MATYKIPNFKGGYSLGEEENALAPNETRNAQNVDISHGDLRTAAGFTKYTTAPLGAPITRLMKFYKNNLSTGAVTSYLIAATATGVFYYVSGDVDDDKIVTSTNMIVGTYTIAAQPEKDAVITVTTTAVGTADTQGTIEIVGAWNAAAVTDTITPIAGTTVYGSKRFDTITSVTGVGWVIGADNDTIKVGCSYEWAELMVGATNGNWDYIGYQTGLTDIIIMGNGADVMKKWDGTTFAALGGTPPKMKSITLHSERVWGIGNVAAPSSVYYSDDLNPENWTGGEDAAGEIFLPTWDGGVCIGISNIFSDVVIFKTNNIFRILGTYPAVYEVKQVYSTVGAIAERTIVSSSDRAFFLTKDGLMYYNGVSVYPLLKDKLKDLVINPSYASSAVSIIYKNKLYCAIPEGSATTNTTVIVYDLEQNNVMLIRGFAVTDFIEFEDKLLFANATGYVYNFGSGTTFDGTAITAYYETPLTDMNAKNITKSIETLYFYASGSGTLQIEMTLDGKTKTKTVTLVSTGKTHAIPFSLEGRRLKVKFSNVTGSTFILSSPEITFDADED